MGSEDRGKATGICYSLLVNGVNGVDPICIRITINLYPFAYFQQETNQLSQPSQLNQLHRLNYPNQ